MKKTTHLLILALLTLIVTGVFVAFIINEPFLPLAASTQAIPIDFLFVLMFSIAAPFLAISLVTMVYCVVVFRQRPGDTEDGPAMKGNPPLEVIWTIIPLAIVMGLAVYGAIVLNDITRASPDEMEVKIVAAQWSWQFEYPQYGITTSDLHLPVNRPILFRFNSVDVIHNFWVPEFRVMQDMVPGMETTLRITPDREGVYKLECNQLCGLLHAYMTAPVTVEAQSNFDDWAEGQKKQ